MDRPASSPSERVPLIAVIGDGCIVEPDQRIELARACGQSLIDAGYRLVTGGLGGIMRAASQGARASRSYAPGCIIGLLPGHDPSDANEYVDTPIATGLDVGRNLIVANADALIAIGGGAGTLSELAVGWQLHRLLVGLRVAGWSGELADRRIDERIRYPAIPEDRVFGASTATEAVALITRWLPHYQRRHRGVARAKRTAQACEP